MTALSAMSLTAGVSSVAVALPVATLITFLFRLREVTMGEERTRTARDSREGKVGYDGQARCIPGDLR